MVFNKYNTKENNDHVIQLESGHYNILTNFRIRKSLFQVLHYFYLLL